MSSDQRKGSADARRFPIGVVARRTGLSKDVLRVWESRYGTVRPSRSESGRRLYTESDVERLALLKAATSAGWSISEVARRPIEELRELVVEAGPPVPPARPDDLRRTVAPPDLVTECLEAVEEMSGDRLGSALSRGLVELPASVFLGEVLVVVLTEIGARWRMGRLGPSQEHLATVKIRALLERIISSFQPSREAPSIVLATPAGEEHELGAMLAAATAAAEGWRAVFIGGDLPAADIAAAVHRLGAAAVGLSIVASGPETDGAAMERELRQLREAVGERVRILIGGSAAAGYADVSKAIGAERLTSLTDLRARLT
ncbi:MAG: MerR family transcriptional regulator [Gemmatimonadota bacterium]|nr:MAG: MerR family transcriptional regulator [Gemmatimonadota bacterium]